MADQACRPLQLIKAKQPETKAANLIKNHRMILRISKCLYNLLQNEEQNILEVKNTRNLSE